MKYDVITPTYIHQIFLHHGEGMEELPPLILENMRSTYSCYPDAIYKLWGIEELDKFIQNHFDEEVVWAFRLLVPFAYKADLARLCLLYIYGGLYVDLSCRLVQAIELPENFGLLAFRDKHNPNNLWTNMINGVIWCREPGRQEIALYIQKIVQNCKDRYYGINALYPTGPVLFGECVAQVMSETNERNPYEFWVGDAYPCGRDINTDFLITKNNTVFALIIKSKPLANISDKFISNAYGYVWRIRQIYGEKDRNFSVLDGTVMQAPHAIIINETGLSVPNKDSCDMISYGPYIILNGGIYDLELLLSKNAIGDIRVEVTSDGGRNVICDKILLIKNGMVKLSFEIFEQKRDIEFRTFATPNFSGAVQSIKLVEIA